MAVVIICFMILVGLLFIYHYSRYHYFSLRSTLVFETSLNLSSIS